jgi:integrase
MRMTSKNPYNLRVCRGFLSSHSFVFHRGKSLQSARNLMMELMMERRLASRMAARSLHKLSPRTIETARKPGRYGDGGGLYLHVDKPRLNAAGKEVAGAKRWVFVCQWQGKRREIGLGSLGVYKLAEVREIAQKARECVARGIDPTAAREAPSSGPTFGEFADAYIASHRASWRNAKHAAQWEMTLRVYAEPIRALKIDAVATDDVLKVLTPIWLEKPETASRTRGRIEMVLAAAKAKHLRTGENPARWKDHLALLLPKRKRVVRGHHAALPYAEAPAFMADLIDRSGASARALELTILTALRTSEVILADWREFDLEAKVWTIPADRMKAHKAHRVPLTDHVLVLLGEKGVGFVFRGARKGRPLSNMAMAEMLKGMRPGFTVHGFRSSFRDWAAEKTNFPREVVEACLAHTLENDVEAAYRRSDLLDKRRKLMTAWERYCRSKV